MPRRRREPIQVKIVAAEATEAEIARAWAEVRRILVSAAQSQPDQPAQPKEPEGG